jgi:hypothetical protein
LTRRRGQGGAPQLEGGRSSKTKSMGVTTESPKFTMFML